MRKTSKNVYLAALGYELFTCSGVERICKAARCGYVSESTAYCWLETGRTEREIITLLRKMGYDIPKEIKGSDDVKYTSTVQED